MPRLALPDLGRLRQLKRAADRRFGVLSRFAQFCMVGASGMVIDLLGYAVLQRVFAATPLSDRGLPGLPNISLAIACAGTASVALALVWNFAWNRRFTFSDRRRDESIGEQFLAYVGGNLLAICVSLSCRFGLPAFVPFFARHLHTAALVGIVAATALSFTLARWVVFRRAADSQPVPLPSA